MLWCRINAVFMKSRDFVVCCKNRKQPSGEHQSTTYENIHAVTTPKVMLWRQLNNQILKVNHCAICCESRTMLFGWHQSTTHENSHKMTTSEVMFWCQPNNKFMKNEIRWKIAKWKYCVWLAPGARNATQQLKKHILAPRSFTETKWDLFRKTNEITSKWCYGSETIT